MSAAAGVRIRPSVPEDLPAIAALERRCFADPWPALSLAAELEPDPRRRCVTAEREGAVAGYLMAWQVADELHIVNVAVDPDRRRGGLATSLLEAVVEPFRADGGRWVTLEVRPSNTGAIAFYRRHGFEQTGRRRAYYRDDGEDALILTLDLTPDA